MKLPAPEHPTLRFAAFETVFPAPLGELASPDALVARLAPAEPPAIDDAQRRAVRDMLREHGYKPTGRGKPASEYLVRACGEGKLGSINVAVDACNVGSLESGFPVSVVDLAKAQEPLRIEVGGAGARYVFNAGGQEIDVAGLPCLCDADGPCANAVKDSQRTKTGASTTRTLSVVWGCAGYEERLEEAAARYRGLLEDAGATTTPW